MKDYSNQIFGKLKVLKFIERKKSGYYWLCKCDCGNEKIIRITNLTSGLTRSCGCLNFQDYTGKRFGRLIVIDLHERATPTKWLCKCDCGNKIIVSGNNLKSGNTQSCGCLFKEVHKIGNPKHKLYNTRIYKIWCGMKDRCYSKKHQAYSLYGGRGITICDEWKNNVVEFYNWAIANGYQDYLTIDRIDNNSNYEPNNCRWVTKNEQQNNTRKNIFYEYKGEKLTLSQLSKKYNINTSTLFNRIKRYNNINLAIETPIDIKKRNKKSKIKRGS